MSRTFEATVEALGSQGDGLARAADGTRLYIPLALPGERVRVRIRDKRGDGLLAEMEELLEPAPTRVAPFCPLFGSCGGCALQHADAASHAAWKVQQVTEALAHRGIEATVAAPVMVPPGRRRRATFSVMRLQAGVVLGFSERLGRRVVDVRRCPLLLPALDDRLPALREALAGVLRQGERGTLRLTLAAEGLDLVLGLARRPGPEEGLRLAALEGVGRVSWQKSEAEPAELLAQRRRLHITLSGIAVELPPGGFLQPSAEGEAVLVGLVREALGRPKRVLDLYAGLGTFGLALAGDGLSVQAEEGNAAAVDALRQAAGRAGLGGRLAAEVRDLDRRPLADAELKAFDAAIFDPPRAGARFQAAALARSPSIRRIAAVSCNPATLARDLRLLVDGGFRLLKVVPVDQFPYAAHVEAVAILAR
ncbi:MAG: class I SAM-dependent RNA methyltransferase [Magnetospirillum sp. WYHS-4]